ncbi:MAG: hypothetical protein ACNA8W_01660 [Bradymonadaceae bacterium]
MRDRTGRPYGPVRTVPSHDKLIEDGEDDLARQVFRWFRPMGRCSMDNYPAELAGRYADFCANQGDLGCYMKLQLIIMGNRFDRMAWSSMGERAHKPSAAELFKAPIDAERFLRGALLRYSAPGERIEVGAWRLARAIGNAGMRDMVANIAEMANDPELDETNHLMATQLLYFLSDEDYGALSHEAARAVGDLEPSPIIAHWVKVQQAAKGL